MADYPISLPNFGADEVDGVDFNYAAHINKLRLEASAIANELGVRGGATGTIGARLAQALVDITTLLGHFDGSGKLPHSGVAGVQPFTPFNSSSAWANYDNYTTVGVQHGHAGWRVTAAGMCEWTGAITLGDVVDTLLLTGAPAPFDGKIHEFKVRRGLSIQPIISLAGVAAFADYSPATALAARPSFRVGDDGMCIVQGIIYAPVAGAGNFGQRIGQVPRPWDNVSHVYDVKDIGFSGGVQVTLDGSGYLTLGNMVGGSVAGTGINMTASPVHAYALEFAYIARPDSISIDVQSDGSGYYNGPDVLANFTGGALGSEYLILDGISYYVGPGTT